MLRKAFAAGLLVGLLFLAVSVEAAVTFVTSGAVTSQTGANPSCALPSGIQANDIGIWHTHTNGDTGTHTYPAGWTKVTQVNEGTTFTHSWAWKRFVGGESGSQTVTISGTNLKQCKISLWRGVRTSGNPHEAAATGQASSNTVNPAAVSITDSTAMIVALIAAGDDGKNLSPMSGGSGVGTVTEAYEHATTTGNDGTIALDYALATTTGSVDLGSDVVDAGNDPWVTYTIALIRECAPPESDASYVAANAQNGQVILYWSSANSPLILRKAGTSITDAPAANTAYAAGDTIGTATVAYNGSAGISGMTCNATSCTNTGLTNGTTYYYKVFPRNGNCYAAGTGAEVNATPQAGPYPAWSYTMAGGSMLKPGIAGEGAIYTSSNASQIVSLGTADGTQSWAPVATTSAVQGWLTWIPISGGGSSAVIGGDQGGKVYSVNTATGATNWSVTLSGADAVQAATSAQLRVYSDATFQTTYTTDVIFAATRNASTTNNKLFALRASDGAVLWTFNGTGSNSVDYAVGQPYVDYERNRVYLATRAGSSGTQSSLWVINSLNGALVASFTLGHLETSPTLSYSGATLWVGNTSGDLYAINPATLAQKWTSPAALGSAVKGFVWEDLTTAGRLYFTTADGNVWCLQDPGAGPPPNPASPVWKTAVAGASMPLMLDALYVGSSDGKVHELNLITGVDAKQFTLAGTVGDISTEDSTQIFAGTSAGTIYKIPLPLP